MDCSRIVPFGLLLAAAGLAAPMQSQSVPSQPPPPNTAAWHPIPQARPAHSPFPIKGKVPYTVEIRPAAAVSAQDRQLESNEEGAVREHAGVQLMDFTANGG